MRSATLLLFLLAMSASGPSEALISSQGSIRMSGDARLTSCYAKLMPDLEMSPEAMAEIHRRFQAGDTREVSVVLKTSIDDQGIAKSVEYLEKSGIEELDDVARKISEVSAVECRNPRDRVMRDSYRFRLDYSNDAAGKPSIAPYFLRSVLPFDQPLSIMDRKDRGFCVVGRYDAQTGQAQDVNCSYDGYCDFKPLPPPAVYPGDLMLKGVAGRVLVRQTVTADGKSIARSIARTSGYAAFDKAALYAAKGSKFECVGSNPVTTWDINYTFTVGAQ